VVLEVNTLPGLTELSVLPDAAAAAGVNYRNFANAWWTWRCGDLPENNMWRWLHRNRNRRYRERQFVLDVNCARARCGWRAGALPGRGWRGRGLALGAFLFWRGEQWFFVGRRV